MKAPRYPRIAADPERSSIELRWETIQRLKQHYKIQHYEEHTTYDEVITNLIEFYDNNIRHTLRIQP